MTFSVALELLLHAGDDALDQPHVAEDHARLHGGDGRLADGGLGALQLDARQLRGALEQRLEGDADAGGDGAAHVVALAGDGVEYRGRAEVDDDQRRAVELDCGDGVDDAVGADVARAIVEDADAGAHAGIDDQRRHLEIAPADFLEDGRQGRHDAAEDGFVDVRGAQVLGLEEVEQQDRVLIDEVLHVGGDAPAGADLFAVEDADGYRRIADVKGQEHIHFPRPAALFVPGRVWRCSL